MFDANLEGLEKTREIFFDSFMHYMVQMDLRQGMSKQEYAMDGLLRDLAEGVCGNWAAEAVRQFRQLGKDKLNSILRLVVKLYQCGSREKIILLLIIKVFIIMSNNLQKENLEIEKNIITVDELSDEYIDKKSKLKKLIAR